MGIRTCYLAPSFVNTPMVSYQPLWSLVDTHFWQCLRPDCVQAEPWYEDLSKLIQPSDVAEAALLPVKMSKTALPVRI